MLLLYLLMSYTLQKAVSGTYHTLVSTTPKSQHRFGWCSTLQQNPRVHVSLNKELLAGPDLMNSLLGVLMRFRKEEVAVMCDIEQMFYSFHVNPSHRDFLQFLWFEANDPKNPVIEYRMNVHLFGNGPSPAVATFGLRKTAADGEEEFRTEVTKFVHRNFYVDDGLTSLPTAQQAIDRPCERSAGCSSHFQPTPTQVGIKQRRSHGSIPDVR
ncbi:hypothetical protein QZH41_005665 [Actinostola sp. cb2023]|nr:hypothetical protein QZH41_005665 [Actinostola sp. cb2023]